MKVWNAPQTITTNFYNTNPLTLYDASGTDQISNHSGKIIFLSFVNLNNQPWTSPPSYWDWLSRLEEVRLDVNTFRTNNSIATELQILTVILNYGSNNNLLQAVNSLSVPPNYPILRDANSVASNYRDAFMFASDNCFPSISSAALTLGNEIWSFFIDEQMTITDKWNNQCTVNNPKDPLSFHNLTTPTYTTLGSFDSTDLNNMKEFVFERIKNLLLAPKILTVEPSIGSSVTLSPALNVDVLFSKPVGSIITDGLGYPMLDPANVKLASNYPVNGGGGTELAVTGILYENSGLAASNTDRANVGAIENKTTLTIENTTTAGLLHPGTVQIDINNGAIPAQRIEDTSDVVLENNFGQPFYTISYNGPEVETIVDDPATLVTDFATFTNPITVTFTDNVTKASSPGTDLDSSNFAIDTSSLTIASGTAPVISGITKVSNSQYDITLNNLTGLEASGSFNITLSDIADNYGNALGGTTTITYTVDTVAPALNPVTIASDNAAPVFAKIADTVTVSFTSSEDIQTPIVTIAGQAASVTGGPQIWSATYTMQASDTEGTVGFVISAIQDTLGNTSGNVTSVTDSSSVTLYKPSPSITSAVLQADNSYITIAFNRRVYSNTGATGSLDAADFSLSFNQNSGTATGASIASVSGSAPVQVNLSIAGTPSGVEIIEITPVADSIYDGPGNPALVSSTTGVVTLNDATVVAADPYVRDNIDDNGTEPSTGGISISPDIIVFKNSGDMLTPLYDNYGGSDPLIVDNYNIGSEAESGQDNYIIVRAQNRGAATATNVTVTVYYAPLSTSILPADWIEIGTTVFPGSIPNDGNLYVSNSLTWPGSGPNAVPAEGHYCLIAKIGSDTDPEPTWANIVASIIDVSSYIQYIRDVNNITYRNIQVADDILPPPAPDAGAPPPPEPGDTPDGEDPVGFYPLPFKFAGAADKDKKIPMQLELHIKLPKDSRALLEIPLDLLDEMKKNLAGLQVIKIEKKRRVAWISVDPYKINYFGEVHLPPRAKLDMRLFVQLPKKYINNRYKVYALQLFKGKELGRVAWFIGRGWKPPRKPFIVYRFFRWILDAVFFVRTKPRYKVKY